MLEMFGLLSHFLFKAWPLPMHLGKHFLDTSLNSHGIAPKHGFVGSSTGHEDIWLSKGLNITFSAYKATIESHSRVTFISLSSSIITISIRSPMIHHDLPLFSHQFSTFIIPVLSASGTKSRYYCGRRLYSHRPPAWIHAQ